MNIPRDFVGVNSPPNNPTWVTCLAILFLGAIFLVAVCGGDPEIEMNVTKVVTPSDMVACDDARIWINVTPENEPSADIVLVIDTSLSMKDEYNNIEIIDYAKGAAKTFVGSVNFSSNNVSVVSYNSIATLEQNLTNNATAILDSIDNLAIPPEEWRGGTNIGEGIRISQQELDKSTDESIEVIVLFTDGTATFYKDDVTEDNYESRWCGHDNCPVSDTICTDYAKNEAQKSKDNNTTIFTVGFFGGVEKNCSNATAVFSRTLLKDIASDETRYYESPTPEDLEDIYLHIYRHIHAATDLIVVEYLSPVFTVLGGCPGDRCTTFPNGTQKIEFEKDILRFNETWNIQINITSQWAGTFVTNDDHSYISYESPDGTRINKTLPLPGPINVTRPLHLKKIAPDSVAACTEFNYTIRLEHTGCMDVRNLTICDTLPEKVSFVSAWCDWPGLVPIYDPKTHSVSIDTTEPFKRGDVIVCDITVLPDEMASGPVLNNASVTFIRSQCIIEDINITEVINNSEISVTKTADYGPCTDGKVAISGDTITYTINVSNPGNINLTKVNVTDTLVDLDGPFGDVGDDDWLNPGEVWTYTGTHTVTEMDVCGSINNTVTANAIDACGNPLPDVEASYCVPTVYTSALNVTKTSDYDPGTAPPGPGDKLTYTINVTNGGNVSLTDLNVTDTLIGHLTDHSGDDNGDGWLNLSEVWTYRGIYTVTDEDVLGKHWINNTVIVNATDPCSSVLRDEASHSIPTIIIGPLVPSIYKEADYGPCPENPAGPGDTINYTITVSCGDVNLTKVNVSDSLIDHLTGPSGDDNNDGWLNLSETWTYRGTYTVTEKDICGPINNTVTANATDPIGNPTEDVYSSWCVPTVYTPVLNITKTADYGPCPDGKTARSGDTITYTINVSNEGNVNLTDVNVTDPRLGLDRETFSDRLEPGSHVENTFQYTVGLDDLGQDITNTVVANATDPCGNDVNDTGSWCVPTEYISAINVNYDRLSLGDQLAQSIGKGPTAKNRFSIMKKQSAS